jgi:hypothetical protein
MSTSNLELTIAIDPAHSGPVQNPVSIPILIPASETGGLSSTNELIDNPSSSDELINIRNTDDLFDAGSVNLKKRIHFHALASRKRLATEAARSSSHLLSQESRVSQDSRVSRDYHYPGFFEDIVPRLLDIKYGPDILPLINTCLASRECPMKESRLSRTDFDYNWDYDITCRAWFDSKVKVSDDPFLKTIRRKDNWLHRHMVASYLLYHKERYEFFLDHCVPPLRCVNYQDDDAINETLK